MRVLFLPMAGGYGIGPLTQCLAIAAEAKHHGHEIAFLCQLSHKHWPERLGYTVYTAPIPVISEGVTPQFFKLADAVAALGLADVAFIHNSIDAELRAINEFQPDLLVSKIKLTAPISAKVAGLPLVSTAMWADHPNFASPLYETSESETYVTAVYNQVLHQYGQAEIQDIGELSFLRSDLKIAPSSPQLDPMLAKVEHLHYVGHLLYKAIEEENIPEWLERWDPNAPLIYVYLGVGDIGPHLYTKVLPEAFDGTEFQVVVSVSNHPELPVLPQPTRNVWYSNALPGLATMRKSKLVIHHGGASTSVGAVLAGAPALIFPGQDAERDSNARNIARVRCGKLMSVSSFSADTLVDSVRKTLEESWTDAIQRLGTHLQQLGGPQRAWRLVEEAFCS